MPLVEGWAWFLPYLCLGVQGRPAPRAAEVEMSDPRQDKHEAHEGGIVIPALLWWAGVPLGIVLLLWLFFFRG